MIFDYFYLFLVLTCAMFFFAAVFLAGAFLAVAFCIFAIEQILQYGFLGKCLIV